MAVFLPLFLLVVLSLSPELQAQTFTSGDCAGNTGNPCRCPKQDGSTPSDCFAIGGMYSCPNPPPVNPDGSKTGLLKGGTNNGRADCPFAFTKGDPLIKGFDGCTWYLSGQAGTVVNLLSEANHVVNTLLVPANLTDEHHGGDGTFHGSISVRYQETVVTSTVDAQGNLTVVLNDKPVPFEAAREMQGLTVKAAQHYPYFGQVAEIVTPAFRFFIHAVQPYDSPAGWNRGHLDFSATTLANSPSMHGLLGQGNIKSGEVCIDDFNFHGEGKEQDYVVPHLDSVDYVYSQFINQKVTRRLQAASHLTYQPAFERLMAGSAHLC